MLSVPIGTIFQESAEACTPPSQRLHLILLGVTDVQASAGFYEALGWKRSSTGHSGFEKFDLGGYALALISKEDLANDLGVAPASPQTGTSALIYLAKTPEEVPQVLACAVAAGGTLVKPATRTPWGIAGYFTDLDGHLFEVDYETAWVFDDEHRLIVEKMN